MSVDSVKFNNQIPNYKLFKVWLFSIWYCLIIGAWLLIIPSFVRAETLNSSSYKIRMGNFNITSGFKSSASYNLTDTVGQTVAEFFSSTGYSIKAGFQYMYALNDFAFTISDLSVDLGTLTPNTFSTASNVLTVSAPGQGYSVTAFEQSKLTKLGSSDAIPDTTCDAGTCTETSASVWTTATNNGFGYNATGQDLAADFLGPNYFRPFPDFSLGEVPSAVMTTTSSGNNRTATITYQVSPPGSQAAGEYSTQIVYIATPVY